MGDARETEKDPDAFRTISEVADDLHLPQHVLRFWETRFPQIKPVKRAGGRRFYRPEDIDLLRGIQQLLYREGYTIKGVQKILKEQGIRHVQDIGVERDVAVMRSAAPERPAPASDGVTFGGLLGLLPRRRHKDSDDSALGELPRDVELPLPFPDDEADRDLADDRGEPLAPLAARGRTRERRLAERRYDAGTYEERIYEERDFEERDFRAEPGHHREPRLTEDFAPRARRDESWDEPEPAAPAATERRERRAATGRRTEPPAEFEEFEDMGPGNAAPSFAPPLAVRPEPVMQRRPTRGPAARVSTAPVEELEDPLLPFMERDAPPPAQAPLEERIRRLKEREAGPPEEYLPPKLRRRAGEAAPEPEHGAAPIERQPRGAAPAAPSAWPELARAEAAAQRDLAAWHEQIVPTAPQQAAEPWADNAPYDSADDLDEEFDATDGDEWYPEPEDEKARFADGASAPQYGDEAEDWQDEPGAIEEGDDAPFPQAGFRVSAPVSARLGMGTLASASGLAPRMSLSSSSPVEAVMTSPSATRRDLHGTPHAVPQHAPAPRAPAAPASPPRSAVPPAAPEAPPRRVGPLSGPIEEDVPPAPLAPPTAGMGPWANSAHGVAPRAAASPNPAFWQGREPFEAPAPEPVDSYLPPHLRTDQPRPSGQGGVQPVLSRDDINRLQAALYELGECRRLLRDAVEPKADAGQN